MVIDYQTKIALMMTSAGSQRKLAALMGVSHQKVGRWLREGKPATIDPETGYVIRQAGARKIPESSHAEIDFAFAIHKELVIQQAKADQIPYNPAIPVFQYRGIKRDGKKGDRVIADHTGYIKDAVRNTFLSSMHKTQKFDNVSLRSTVNFHAYAKQSERQNKNTKRTKEQRMWRNEFQEARKIAPQNFELPIYTKMTYFGPLADVHDSMHELLLKLATKHETTAIEDKLTDQYLLQTYPQSYAAPKTKIKPKSTRKRK